MDNEDDVVVPPVKTDGDEEDETVEAPTPDTM